MLFVVEVKLKAPKPNTRKAPAKIDPVALSVRRLRSRPPAPGRHTAAQGIGHRPELHVIERTCGR